MEDDGSLIKKNKAFASFIGQGPASNLFQASSWKFLNICTGADPPSNQPWPATAGKLGPDPPIGNVSPWSVDLYLKFTCGTFRQTVRLIGMWLVRTSQQ
jgi:hypothetical protein